MYYYEILIEARIIPDYDEIKRRYFDDNGNMLTVINYEMFDTRPYLTFTPVMYMDGSGHMPKWVGYVLWGIAGLVVVGAAVALMVASGWSIAVALGALYSAAAGLALHHYLLQ